MYPNLLAELARRKMTQGELAGKLGMTKACLSKKINGKSGFTLKEANKIKRILVTDETLDYLFMEES